MSVSPLRALVVVWLWAWSSVALAIAPTVTTTPAGGLTTSSAQLSGSANPGGEQTTGWFRLSQTNPGTCDDTFGTRVPVSSGTDLGSGSATVPYSITTTGLTPAATYYFCAIVQNGTAKAYGGIQQFTVPSAPITTTVTPTTVGSTTATLLGRANPVGVSTLAWFRYSGTDPGTCSDSFGTRAPTTAGTGSSLGSGLAEVDFNRAITGLLPGNTYYFCAVAENSNGMTFGSVLTFTTAPAIPTLGSISVSPLTGTSATFNTSVNPGGDDAYGWFRYSTSSPGSCNDAFGTRVPAPPGVSLAASNSTVPLAQGATGLTAGTTYWVCAFAENDAGVGMSSLGSFTTPSAPAVTTGGLGTLGSTTATLTGSAVANRAATTAWFRYSTTSPGTCNDTFGTRAPGSGTLNGGSSTSSVAFSQVVTGLTAGTLYYYCAIAENAEGKSVGLVLSFTTLAAPTVTTTSATALTSSGATLGATFDANGSSTYVWFRYATTNPGTCTDSFGTATTQLYVGADYAPANTTRAISGLQPGTTYYFCAIASNEIDTAYGGVLSFETLPTAPVTGTSSATLLTSTTATLNGSTNPGGAEATGWFRYSTTSPGTCNDTFGTRAPDPSGGTVVPKGNSAVAFSQAITGLTSNTTYYFCAISQNSVSKTYGSVVSLITPAPPTVLTTGTAALSSTTATLAGTVNPNRALTGGWFRYSTTSPGTCNDTFGSRAPTASNVNLGSGASATSLTSAISGLSAGTVYYFCAIAENSEGKAYGSVLSLETMAAPTITTTAATLITASSATLGADVDPNGSNAYVWFRYSTVNPGTCSDAFGTGTTSLYVGNTYTPVSTTRAISGLAPGTTYYFCALVYNDIDDAVGGVLSFTTLPTNPTVSTSSATLLTSTTATLNGAVNPGGDVATAWFRYATTSPGTCNDTFGTRTDAGVDVTIPKGTSSVAFSLPITGLTANTTYYACAIGQNSVSKQYGTLVSFTTPSGPTVTTTGSSGIGATYATLTGLVNPNRAQTYAWFRYGTTNPTTCNDTFGSRIPAAPGVSAGSGTSNYTLSQTPSSLSAGTTYYFCAVAQNAEGTSFGAVMSFTTAAAPTVTTQAATLVTSSGATLGADVDPNGSNTYLWFRYSTTNPGVCSDGFGTATTAAYVSNVYTPVPATRAISGLLPGTTYYYCALVYNDVDEAYGGVLSFTTLPTNPTVSTSSPTLLTSTTATFNGSVNPGGAAATGWFRYSTSSPGSVCNDSFGTRAPAADGATIPAGTSSVPFSQAVTGLSASTTYYVCAIGQNSVSTGFGSVTSFTTPAPPTVTTNGSSGIGATYATLSGTINPNRAATYGWYRYSTTNPVTCNDTFGSRLPLAPGTYAGASTANFTLTQAVSSLSSGTTYYFCAIAQSAEGTSFGEVKSFVTTAAPTVTTLAASAVTAGGATLGAEFDANGSPTYLWFRYSTTNPVVCSDTFGTVTTQPYVGTDYAPAQTSRAITSLLPGTTYYYCAIASNEVDDAYGAVLSFTTLPLAPSVTTGTTTQLTSTTATFNGSVNPNGAETTVWFRYSTASPGTCNDTFGSRAPSSDGTTVPAGNGSVPVTRGVTGLSADTTYYVCALAQNSAGLSVGAVGSFTTPTQPIAVTAAVTSLSSTTVTLNGTGDPNRATTGGWFRYGTANPGTCNDTFGSRSPTGTTTVSLGSGATPVAYTQNLSSLSAGTTYYYCAIVQSAEGISFGEVMSFRTYRLPTVSTLAVSAITSSGATFNASVNPGGLGTTTYWRYSTSNPGTCSDVFGTASNIATTTPADFNTVDRSTTSPALLPGTTYYVCAIAYNSIGTAVGELVSFTTFPAMPSVTTGTPSSTAVQATLSATVNPGGASTTVWFRYDTTSPVACDDSFGTRAPTAAGTVVTGTSNTSASEVIPVTAGTTYYVCAIAESSVGKVYGGIRSFTAPRPPTVATLAATPVTAATAQLNGNAHPNGYATTGWFRYSTTAPASCTDAFGARVPASGGSSISSGASTTAFAQSISGLLPGTTYHFCAIASSTMGVTTGEVLSFTTPALAPSVTTLQTTGIGVTVATLQASANPNGGDTTAWFRYSTTNPVTCNDTFGTRAPVLPAAGDALGAGTTGVAFNESLTGLTLGATYYVCAIAENEIGKSFGSILSFTTTAAPTVTTTAATSVASTTVTLAGTANPNANSTTGWFRFSTSNPGACNDSFGTRAPTSSGSALGAGAVAAPYTQAVTGLAPSTTYYFCAIANNVSGTGFGAVMSFTTTAAPSVVTQPVTAITASTATLTGTADPNLDATTAWFRYGTTSPGTCNDTFGTRTPASGGADVGSGTEAVPFTANLTGLSAGTTYYVCAIASNSVGTRFGSVVSFITPATPTVTLSTTTGLTGSTATVAASGNPRGSDATGWFRYGTTSPGTCNDSFGTRAPVTDGTGDALGSGQSGVAFSEALTGLTPDTTYYFCALASNAVGTGVSTVGTFTTPARPTVVTLDVTALTTTGATLQGTGDPNTSSATGWFRYGTSDPGTCNDLFGTRAPSSGGTALGALTAPVAYSRAITGLTPETTYYVCALASNAEGTGTGAVISFTTPSTPSVTTLAATSVQPNSATLEGEGDPNSGATTAWFRYSTTSPGACNDTFGTRTPSSGGTSLGAGTSPVAFEAPITGLASATTYYFCAIAENAAGKVYGSVLSLATPAAPAVTTNAATAVTGTVATLNGTANPRGAAATGWFRYDTTNPGTCTDAFGTRAPVSGGTDLGAGSAGVAYTASISGLTRGTTYWVCAIASNTNGTSVGSPVSFTTADVPTVTTLAPTPVSATGATLQGNGVASRSATTAWFRYDTVDPGTCNDTFGTRAPSGGGSSLGSGTSLTTYSQAITGLTATTTYYVCAIAQNAEGTAVGSVVSFTTASPPLVSTATATLVTGTTATLNGMGTPRGATATGWFRYSSTDPGTCSDAFGTRTPSLGGTNLGAGTSGVAFSANISGLANGTTYYYCAIASNTYGVAFGSVLTLTTPNAPTVTTLTVSSLASTSVTLEGTANPNAQSATGWFRTWTVNPGTCNDTTGVRAPTSSGTSLGSGVASVPYSQPITGLSPNTTYYVCAIASNAVGTRFGGVVSFTTPTAPTVTTLAATAITGTSATMNASANPNAQSATGWLRYSTVNPGTCNDTFGTRAPAAGGTALGSGSSSVPYAESLTGLANGTTYFFCAIASSASGNGYGSVLSFTTASLPTAVTVSASGTSSTSASVSGSGNPNRSSAIGAFRYGTSNPGTCSAGFGTRVPATGGTSLGSGSTSVSFSESISGLSASTTYYVCAVVENALGTAYGSVLTLRTAGPPSVETGAVDNLASTQARLNALGNPSGSATEGWFRYATTRPASCNDTFGTRAPAGFQVFLGAGSSNVPFQVVATGLTPSTTYHYCAIASSSEGMAFGDLETFTTPSGPPVVVTDAATSVTSEEASLNGTGTPGGSDATGWFRWSTTNPGVCTDAFGTRVPASGGTALGDGTTGVPFTEDIDGLFPEQTVWFCAIASNAAGTSFGQVLTFVTGSAPPFVTTEKVVDFDEESATIAGTANPLGSEATGWFRVGDFNPGDCDDSFGTRFPEEGGEALGAGTDAVLFELDLEDLLPNQQYFFCAAASNDGGAAFGQVRKFTTDPDRPIVRADDVTLVDGKVTLNGLVDPRGAATTAWFRWGEGRPERCDDDEGTRLPAEGGTDVGDGRVEVPFARSVDALTDGSYYVCAFAENAGGLGESEPRSFTVEGGGETDEGCQCDSSGGPRGGLVVALGALVALLRRRGALTATTALAAACTCGPVAPAPPPDVAAPGLPGGAKVSRAATLLLVDGGAPDLALVWANGGADTRVDTQVDKAGLSLHLVPEPILAQRVARYVAGETPYLRASWQELAQHQLDLCVSPDLPTCPQLAVFLGWEDAEALVVRGRVTSAADLAQGTIAVTRHAGHLDTTWHLLHDAGVAWSDVRVLWKGQRSGPGSPGEAFQVDAQLAATWLPRADVAAFTVAGPDGDTPHVLDLGAAGRSAEALFVRRDHAQTHADEVLALRRAVVAAQGEVVALGTPDAPTPAFTAFVAAAVPVLGAAAGEPTAAVDRWRHTELVSTPAAHDAFVDAPAPEPGRAWLVARAVAAHTGRGQPIWTGELAPVVGSSDGVVAP